MEKLDANPSYIIDNNKSCNQDTLNPNISEPNEIDSLNYKDESKFQKEGEEEEEDIGIQSTNQEITEEQSDPPKERMDFRAKLFEDWFGKTSAILQKVKTNYNTFKNDYSEVCARLDTFTEKQQKQKKYEKELLMKRIQKQIESNRKKINLDDMNTYLLIKICKYINIHYFPILIKLTKVNKALSKIFKEQGIWCQLIRNYMGKQTIKYNDVQESQLISNNSKANNAIGDHNKELNKWQLIFKDCYTHILDLKSLSKLICNMPFPIKIAAKSVKQSIVTSLSFLVEAFSTFLIVEPDKMLKFNKGILFTIIVDILGQFKGFHSIIRLLSADDMIIRMYALNALITIVGVCPDFRKKFLELSNFSLFNTLEVLEKKEKRAIFSINMAFEEFCIIPNMFQNLTIKRKLNDNKTFYHYTLKDYLSNVKDKLELNDGIWEGNFFDNRGGIQDRFYLNLSHIKENGEFKGMLHIVYANHIDKETIYEVKGYIDKKRIVDMSLGQGGNFGNILYQEEKNNLDKTKGLYDIKKGQALENKDAKNGVSINTKIVETCVGRLEVFKSAHDIDTYELNVNVGRDIQNGRWYLCLHGVAWEKNVLLMYRLWK